ncbi:D-alanine--D-alanine ligase [Limisalsivibrio acetivorans]|uniref:D-alanine--D-alanine ligase n=1 Tax=Limisalsivibrio acetivorans TaxID=1304888 RepID=UPI0003B5AEEB|nr:D-alanine--D-alanine ligase [Limisalsivibrio acetivorans]
MLDKRITLLYGGISSERDVSLKSGEAVYRGLQSAGFRNIRLLDADRNLAAELEKNRPDAVLSVLHGTYGEDGRIQGLLELMGIPYAGSDSFSSAVAFDKLLTKMVFERSGIPSAEYVVIDRDSAEAPFLPCVVKPSRQGSTIGIGIVKEEKDYRTAVEEAFRHDDRVFVERYIKGKELTVGILESKSLPIIWINPLSGFYDYESKYTKGKTEYNFETGLSEQEEKQVKEYAADAFKALGCRDYGRVDFIWDGETPYALEANTLPGMTETSLLPKAADKAGISFDEMITAMVKGALER